MVPQAGAIKGSPWSVRNHTVQFSTTMDKRHIGLCMFGGAFRGLEKKEKNITIFFV